MAKSQLFLKSTPPRTGRTVLARRRLEERWAQIHERIAVVVSAAQGFGKTTLLAQWRRNWLSQGALVAWATLDSNDDRTQFVELLLHSLRAATGRSNFAEDAARETRELDAITVLLAEIAALAAPTVIVLDDAHRVPSVTVSELLDYLLHNAPPNLHFMIGTRRPLDLSLTDLMAKGEVATLGNDDLRLRSEESFQILRIRFDEKVGLDDAMRLHELTGGWPLGLQLAAAEIEGAENPSQVIENLSARRGDIRRFFLESFMSRLAPETGDFLVRISILESINADVCAAVTGLGVDEADVLLRLLSRNSAIVAVAEGHQWTRLHTLARDFLLGQFDKLPADERRACYQRAADWYAAHEVPHEAARHALAAGDEAKAIYHASGCLREIASAGRLSEARDWIARLPGPVVSNNTQLQLTIAWITALGEDPAAVRNQIDKISERAGMDDRTRFEADLILAAAAIFLDEPAELAKALDSWKEAPAGGTPLQIVALANSLAALAFARSETEKARALLTAYDPSFRRMKQLALAVGYGDQMFGLSYLREGRIGRAIEYLSPLLANSDREGGRRSLVSSMLASTLATAHFFRGDHDRASALLADRIDVIERLAMPDAVLTAYCTLARLAVARNEEERAHEVLAALHEFGTTRQLPRLVFRSLGAQVRLHSVASRVDAATGLLHSMEEMKPVFDQEPRSAYHDYAERTLAIATAYVSLAQGSFDAAEAALSRIGEGPAHLQYNQDVLLARALRALILYQRGSADARSMLEEVVSLAQLAGYRGFIETAHPCVGKVLGSEGRPAGRGPDSKQGSGPAPAVAQLPGAGETAVLSGLLTPKEAEVLSLLAGGMTNKAIARAMDIGEQTVKWHLKNVFWKLDAGSRKHAVDRARLLGLLKTA